MRRLIRSVSLLGLEVRFGIQVVRDESVKQNNLVQSPFLEPNSLIYLLKRSVLERKEVAHQNIWRRQGILTRGKYRLSPQGILISEVDFSTRQFDRYNCGR